MLRLAAIAAAVTLALAADPGPPPDASPYQIIEALRGLEPRPYDELASTVRDSVEAALVKEDCQTATELFIDVFSQDYPEVSRIRDAEDFDYFWWMRAGKDAYPDGFACFMFTRLTKFADQYQKRYADGWHADTWCGETRTRGYHPLDQPERHEIDTALVWLGFVADAGNIRAIRALLAADDEYEFVQLGDITRYALLVRLAERTELTSEEQKLRDWLAARLPAETRQDIGWDSGYSFAMEKYGECGSSVR